MNLSINGITLNVECPQLDYISEQLDTLITKVQAILDSTGVTTAHVDNFTETSPEEPTV
jgi:hypothetical protein